VIVVTGGARGIGRALCERFHAEGAKSITVADLDADEARKVAERVDGHAVLCDVAQESDIAHVVEQTVSNCGPIDLFCSNAGVFYADSIANQVGSAPDKLWMHAWSVNVMAHVYAARICLPSMVARGGGHFLQTISAAGLLTQIDGAVYAATKHAAVGFAESLAITHRDQGIKVSMLCPQGVDTKMLRASDTPVKAAVARDGIMTADEVAAVVIDGLAADAFLILPHASVAGYLSRKAENYDHWIASMAKLRRVPQLRRVDATSDGVRST